MLDELSVKGFGIIEEIKWCPAGGLNVITGETGAGKSLVVDAVEALLSGQAREEDIRFGSNEAQVEGIFRLEKKDAKDDLQALLAEKGLETGEDALVISCDFRRQGRTTPRVNRQAVSRALLKDISAVLVDIHGQSEHLSLLDKSHHLGFLDAYAHVIERRRAFASKVQELHRMEREIQSLSRNEQDLARHTELLTFQIDEIKKAELQEGEEQTLAQELNLLMSAEKLKAISFDIYRILYGDETAMNSSSVIDKAGDALAMMKQLIDKDPTLNPKMNYLDDTVHGLEELAREIQSYGENMSYDPERLEEVQNRLELLKSFKRKYGPTISDMLAYLDKAEKELSGLAHSDERKAELEVEREKLRKDLGITASKLSQDRAKAARKLETAVKKELAELGMGKVDFIVAMEQKPSNTGLPLPDGKSYEFNGTGVDGVAFLASTNPGEPAKALDRIASTGEISRFMLALKSALAEADTIPILIFDEIDIGIGGRSGEVIGQKLWKLSRHHQVICVTHLPQIAAFADAQYRVTKQAAGQRTSSRIETLDRDMRIKELAAMIGGPKYTANALNASRELIESAEAWKKK
jgi:DNA repair protein RecN (Recombination protein N)